MAKPTAQELARERLKKKFVSELTRSQHAGSKFFDKYGHSAPYEEYEKMTNERDERNVDLPITTFEEGYLYPETLHTKRVPYEGDPFGYHWYIDKLKSKNTPFSMVEPPVARSRLERDLNQYILETKGKGEYRNAYELAKAQGGDQSYKHGQSRLEPGDGVSDFSKRQSRPEEMPEEEYETPVSGQTRVK